MPLSTSNSEPGWVDPPPVEAPFEPERVGAELIVMGTHGHGAVFDLIVGGVSHAVLRQTTIPILFVPLRKS